MENLQNKSIIPDAITKPIPRRWSDKPPVPVAPIIESKSVAMSESTERNESKVDNSLIKRNKPKTELEMKIIEAKDEHPSKKKDIFKAIFDSDSESDESEADETSTTDAHVMASLTKPSSSTSAIYSHLPDDAFRPKSAREINILRNTSPPRGIFSGLIKKVEPSNLSKSTETVSSDKKSTATEKDNVETPDAYGPCLPPSKPSSINGNLRNATPIATPTTSSALNAVASVSLGKDYKVVYEEKWIEKSDGEKKKKSKKEKKHKEDRDKHKSKKQKKEKHKKKKR